MGPLMTDTCHRPPWSLLLLDADPSSSSTVGEEGLVGVDKVSRTSDFAGPTTKLVKAARPKPRTVRSRARPSQVIARSPLPFLSRESQRAHGSR